MIKIEKSSIKKRGLLECLPNDNGSVIKQIVDYLGPSSVKLIQISNSTSVFFKSTLDDIAAEEYSLLDEEAAREVNIPIVRRVHGELSIKINVIFELGQLLGIKNKYERLLLWRRLNNKIKSSDVVNNIIELLINEKFLRDNVNLSYLNNPVEYTITSTTTSTITRAPLLYHLVNQKLGLQLLLNDSVLCSKITDNGLNSTKTYERGTILSTLVRHPLGRRLLINNPDLCNKINSESLNYITPFSDEKPVLDTLYSTPDGQKLLANDMSIRGKIIKKSLNLLTIRKTLRLCEPVERFLFEINQLMHDYDWIEKKTGFFSRKAPGCIVELLNLFSTMRVDDKAQKEESMRVCGDIVSIFNRIISNSAGYPSDYEYCDDVLKINMLYFIEQGEAILREQKTKQAERSAWAHFKQFLG